MMARATFNFLNGEIYQANLRGRGPRDIERKCQAIAARLESHGRGDCLEWEAKFRETIPGREFIRVNCGHARGTVYRVDLGTPVIKRLN